MNYQNVCDKIEQGTDLKIIKELLGHENIKTTEMYTHIADTYKSKIKKDGSEKENRTIAPK